MKNCIFLSFDDIFFKYAKVCLNSLKRNYPDHPMVLVYYEGSDSQVFSFINDLEKVDLLDIAYPSEKFKNLNLGVIGSIMTYSRFLLWEEYFNRFDTIVYLDCDTVILKPFPELFKHNHLFAVSDFSNTKAFNTELDTYDLKKLTLEDGIDLGQINMINAGVLAIPKSYRKKEHFSQIWSLTKRYNKYANHSDQSILTLWILLNKMPISNECKYNFQIGFITRSMFNEINVKDIKILHYAFWKPEKNIDFLKEKILLANKFINNAILEFERFS